MPEEYEQLHKEIAKLQSDCRIARVKEQEASKKIAKLQQSISIADKLVTLALQHNHTEPEMDGELNMIHWVLEAEIDRFSDDEIPF